MTHTKKNKWTILNYEIQMYLGVRMLQGVRYRPAIGLRDITEQLLQSALTEVKALHIRILVQIFLERNPKFNDINIDDLLPAWRTEHPIVTHNLQHAYHTKIKIGELQHSPNTFLNKFLAHADKKRGDSFNLEPLCAEWMRH